MFYIYRITNLVNGKTYIGQHKFSLGKKDYYKGSGVLLKPALKKYGIENFKKDIIEVALSRFEANVLEKYYIAKERAIGKAEYNLADGGEGTSGLNPWNKGIPHTDEARHKMSESQKGNQNHKGKPCSEETKRKISEVKKGRPTWNKGKNGWLHHTEEDKRKQSEAQRGKHWYNNGKVNKFCYECPEGFKLGMIK